MLAILCLGANLGDRGEAIRRALSALGRLPGTRVLRYTNIYETKPEGVPDLQPDYLNCVAELETSLTPEMLLGACFGIEADNGRERAGVKSARTLDIDILIYEGVQSDDPSLVLPHPRMLERRFVLEPLAELYPGKEVLGVNFEREFNSAVPPPANPGGQ